MIELLRNSLGLMVGVTVLPVWAVWFVTNRVLQKRISRKTAELQEELLGRQQVEEELRASKGRCKAIFNVATDALFLHDLETGAILDVNQKVCDMFGLSREEALHSDLGDLSSGVPPYTQEEAAGWLRKAAAGEPQLFEWQARDRSGRLFWIEVDMHRAVIGLQEQLIVSARDISARKKDEKILQQSLQRLEELQVIIGKSPAIVFLWQAADGWPVEYVSENVAQLGYTAEEFMDGSVSYADLIHGDDLERVGAEVVEFSASGVAEFRQEYRLVTRSGEIIWTDDVTWIRRDETGQITHYQGIVLDISARKKAEEEIKRGSEDLRVINGMIKSCASTLDLEQLLEQIMAEALAISGLEGGAICLLTPESTLEIAVHQAGSDVPIEAMTTKAVKVGACLCGECARDHQPLILADREAVLKYAIIDEIRVADIQFHASFPLITGERCLGVLCVHTRQDTQPGENSLQLLETVAPQIAMAIDNAQLYTASLQQASIFEDKAQGRTDELNEARLALLNLVEDLNSANSKLKELDQLKSMFIASMSHELRTPLNSIIGFSSLILGDMTGPINEEQRDMLSRVSKSGKHLLSLITDVIDIAKIESGKIASYPEEFLLADVIREAVGQVEMQATDKGLVLEQRLPLEPIRMCTDRRRLLQCLINYLSNGVKFSLQGRVTIEVVMCAGEGAAVKTGEAEAPRSRNMVEISVTDTGIGISQEDVGRLFGSFVRLDTPLKTTIPGTGLGLYLTRKLAREVLGGEVGVESEAGVGSRFWIRLPLEWKGTK